MPIALVLGDITSVDVDAIVNAANSELAPGGGVCGAIHAAAGPGLAQACAEWLRDYGPVPTGQAAITPAFRLPSRFVIHAVGPRWQGGDAGETESLARAYTSAVELADECGCASIAFPSISTGIYGFPLELAAPIAVASVTTALDAARRLRCATFVLYNQATMSAFENAIRHPAETGSPR